MMIMTSSFCPQCDQIMYMVCAPKKRDDGSIILTQKEYEGNPHTIADGIYLDKDGVCCVAHFDQSTQPPYYYCIHCRWEA